LIFQINYRSGKPVYLQLVDQVKAAAASGALRVGEPVPSIRPLAEELKVNRNTVAKAYAELEREGVIETRPGKGSLIAPSHSPFRKAVRLELLVSEIDQVIVQAHHLQVERDEFLRLVGERLDALEKRQEASVP
jgi:GntR family transcriptional regulator